MDRYKLQENGTTEYVPIMTKENIETWWERYLMEYPSPNYPVIKK